MAEQGGLLAFLNSAAGQGLLGAAGAALSGNGNARQNIGRGLLGGIGAYGNAQENQIQQQRVQSQDDWMKTQRGWAEQDRTRQDADRASRENFLNTAMTPQPVLQQSQSPADLKAINPYTDPNFIYETAKINNLPGIDKVPMGVKPINPLDAIRARYSPEEASQLHALTQPPKPRTMSVKPGETILNADTLQEVYSAPEREAPTELARLTREMNSLPPGSPLRATYQAAINKSTSHAPGASISVNTGQKGLDNEFKLRGEFKSEPVYKAHQEMQSAYSQIKQSLKQANPAGDLAGATKLMKLLDPGSVVRESELGMAMAASGLMDRLSNYGSMVLSGHKLTPRQRTEFQTLADALYSESVSAYNGKRGEYEKLGGDYGLDASRAIGQPATQPTPSSGGWSIKPVSK